MDFKSVASNPVVRYLMVMVAGIAIGALFYPTKHIEEKLRVEYEERLAHVSESHAKELTQIHEAFVKKTNEYSKTTKEQSEKINQLTVQVHELKSKTKTAYYKVVRPDGTVEIKKFSESDVEESTKVITAIQQEFKEKVDSIEKKWEELHKQRVSSIKKEFDSKEQDYQERIKRLESSKVVDINKKVFGLEFGAMLNKNYYGHVTADVFGPLFIGVQSELGPAPTAGAGIGLRF